MGFSVLPRRWQARAVLAMLMSCMVMSFPAVAYGHTSEENDPEANLAWFETTGLEIVLAQGEDVFGEEVDQDLKLLSLGTPIRAFTFVSDESELLNPQTAFVESSIWIAPVLKDGQAIGVLHTEGQLASRRTNTELFADVRLGTEVGGIRQGATTLIYDRQLQAWFAYSEGLIEPGDAKGEEYVLGNVPFDIFMSHRADLIANDATVKPRTVDTQSTATPETYLTATRFAVVIAILATIALFSLAWLKWADDKRFNRDEQEESASTAITDQHPRNRWDPFAKARLLIHPHISQPPRLDEEKDTL